MGKGSKAPAAPDPYQTASAEAQFNRFDTYSPSGSGVRYGYTDPTTNEFTQGVAPQGSQSAVQTMESPWERAIRESLQPASVDLTNRIVGDNITNMPDAPRVQDRGTVAQSIFDRSYSMMKPGIDQSNNRLLNNLQARGIPIGGKAFNDAYGAQQRETQDTISRLAMDADINAGGEQSRLFGMDQASRQNAISELVAAMGGGYNPPSAVPNGQGAGVNYSGLVGEKYKADMANYNQQQANQGATLGALGSLGGAMLMKCSESYKEVTGQIDTDDVADAIARLPIRYWRYLPEHAPNGDNSIHMGPMAEDFHALTGLGGEREIHVIDALGITLAGLKSALQRIAALERAIVTERVH
ncbi:MAG: hypothetical protein IPM06_21000 [Rhizobiales bacterium]|nr:hypothetical protein [Hyphomicrobiales bacterium]